MHWIVREILGRATRRVTRWWFNGFERATRRCRESQLEALLPKLQRNAASDFGHQHFFDQIRSVADFRANVPITDYGYVAPYIDRVKRGDVTAMFAPGAEVLMFAMTSGTTSDPKFIPVTRESLAEYRRGWMLWGIRTYDEHHAIYRMKVVQLVSNYDVFRTEAGIPCGSVSGLTTRGQMRIVRERYCVPPCLAKVSDVNAKYYGVLRYSLTWPVGMATAANPSTVISLAKLGDDEKESLVRDLADGTLTSRFDYPSDVREELAALTRVRHPERARELEAIIARTGRLYPKDYWPMMQVLANWTGGSMGPYLNQLPQFYGDVPIRDIGLVASEGRMTIPLADRTAAGVLDVKHNFFEFVPESEIDSAKPTVLEAHELVEGERYFILLTTSGGLYRYNIHDLVRCTGFLNETPLLEFLNKGSNFSSLTGEKLSEFQVARAVAASLGELNLTLTASTLAPVWGDPPFYALLVEESDLPNPPTATRLAQLVDRQLIETNVEYETKRTTHRLGSVRLLAIPAGAWREFARERVTSRGASAEQYKHPALVPDLDFAAKFPLVDEFNPECVAPAAHSGLRGAGSAA